MAHRSICNFNFLIFVHYNSTMHRFTKFQSYFLWLLLILVICSCRKKENLPPSVTFIQPSENTRFTVLDTINISANISDDNTIAHVSFSITDNNYITVAAAADEHPGGRQATVSRAIVLDNIEMSSGQYYLLVTASDGILETRQFRKIYINEMQKKMKAVYFVTANVSSQVNVFKIDSAFQVKPVITLSGDFAAADVSSENRLYYVLGKYSGALNAVNVQTNMVNWNVPANNNMAAPRFSDVCSKSGYVFVSFFTGEIKSFDKSGNIDFNALAGDYVPGKIFAANNLVFLEEQQASGTQKYLAVYLSNSVLMQRAPMNLDVVSFCEKDADNIFVVGNSNGQGHVLLYTLSLNNFYEPHMLPAGLVHSAVRTDSNNYLIGCDAAVQLFQYNPIGLLPFIPGVAACNIQYDDVDNVVILSEGMKVKYYDYNTGNLLKAVSYTDTIRGLRIMYNK